MAEKGRIFLFGRGSKILQAFLYLCFLTLWFKDNFHPLRKLALSPLIPFVPLMILLVPRVIFFLKTVSARTAAASIKKAWILLLILALAVAVRLPFFLHPAGLMDSDDAVMGLMGKHISEGKAHPVYMYGQSYIGSLASHFYALFFRIFGYSPALLRISAFLFFLGFLAVQFFLLRSVFSESFARLTTLFLSLPMGSLIKISLDNSGGFSLVLLLGSAVIGLAYVVVTKGRDRWLGPLGFLMGVSFWTHQMTLPFLLTAGAFLIIRYRLRIRKYLEMALWFVVGAFPFILYGACAGFGGVGQFFSGEKMVLSADRFRWFLRETGTLIASRPGFRAVLLFLLFLFGLAFLFWEALKKRRLSSRHIYTLFLTIFLFIYFFSAYSGAFRTRYLYPLYFALPVLVLAPLHLIKARLARAGAFTLLALFLLVPDGWNLYVAEVKTSVRREAQLNTLSDFMIRTGQRYWLADYWSAYLLTALTGERLIVCPLNNKRYRPYELEHDNTPHSTNYLFSLDTNDEEFYAGTLRETLGRLGMAFKGRRLFEYVLTYDISPSVPPHVLIRPFPERPPAAAPLKIVRAPHHWSLECQVRPPPEMTGFSACLNIPGSFSVSGFMFPGRETVVMDFPVPPQNRSGATLFTDFVGIPLENSTQELDLDRIPFLRAHAFPDVAPVSGLSSPLEAFGRNGRLCSREAAFLLPVGPDAPSGIRLRLYSPFSFRAVSWHGLYEQTVEIFEDGAPLGTYRLEDGENDIFVPLKASSVAKTTMSLKLVFRYQMAFDYDSLGFKKISALMTAVDVVR